MLTTSDDVLLQSNLPDFKIVARGKVRDIWAVDDQHLLFVATDRISAFDVVMKTGIPGKGQILTAISVFWFELLKDVCGNHLITADIDKMPAAVQRHRKQLAGRTMLVKRLRILPVEAIVRGYLAGSGLKEYQAQGTVCGQSLPPGLVESSRLAEPLYTPSTKADIGEHDLNIHPDQAARLIGQGYADQIQNKAIAVYSAARDYAAKKGIIIADTKFEFGTDANGTVVLADEVLTPDSSRFWPADTYAPGRPQDSFDKQYLRDYLERSQFNKNGQGIKLPEEVIRATRARYLEAYRLLTG